jgi:diadenosine tetraphosphate (Ap4A) HIT family hydrolase
MNDACPFCGLPASRIVYEDEMVVATRDSYPVSPGHTLLVPRRHVASVFDVTKVEQAALWTALDKVKLGIDSEFHPRGYNIGINDGMVAGQTVMHLHIHVIPRYEGDCVDPRGGVRWILPDKARYWEKDDQ